MFNRRDLPLDGSALLDDVIVSEMAARRSAPITDTAVGLLAALVAAVDSRPIPNSPGAYDWLLDVEAAQPTPLLTAQTAERVRLPVARVAEPTPPQVSQIVIHRTWDGPRHRRNRPLRRRVTGSVAAVSVVATTLGVSGVAAAVSGDPLRPFHSVVTRVWHGVAGPRPTDAREGIELNPHPGSATVVDRKHRQATAAPQASHVHPVHASGTPHWWSGAHGEHGTPTGPYVPGGGSSPIHPGFPVHSGSGGPVVDGPVSASGGSTDLSNQPGHPSGPVWLHSIDFPWGGITSSHVLP
jgi:hypothetical protein